MSAPLVDHVGVLVADLKLAIERWTQVLGYSFTEIMNYRTDAYVDAQTPHPHHHDAKIAFSHQGPPYIELMEFTGEGTHAPAQGEGFHHLGFFVPDPAGRRDELAAMGISANGECRGPDGRPILWFTERDDLHNMRLEYVGGEVQQPVYTADGNLARREDDEGDSRLVTHLIEDAASFVDDALAGLAHAHPGVVQRVDGGVIRTDIRPGKVAIVIGGGSGHFPAFAGYVGTGLADAAVVGQVFASPSTAQILRVCDTVPVDAGVLFVFGNYAGDVLNFEAAAAQLRERGVPATCLPVTDDVASAPPDEAARRRGVAGDVPVIKVIGAAAEADLAFDEVVRIATLVNDRTRSFGLAFTGATMPGQHSPMFTVPAGSMGVGLGIHGEPGIGEQPLPPARAIAALLAEAIWCERPADADARVAVLLNGLGATSYEELYVLWHYVADELDSRGARIIEPLVGDYVTSLDMAGCSLTATWLDDELEGYWLAPAESVALRRGTPHRVGHSSVVAARPTRTAQPAASAASAGSRALAGRMLEAFTLVADVLAGAQDELGKLDSFAGDGDHGQGMARGSSAAAAAAGSSDERSAGAPDLLAAAGAAWADAAGGTSGALWGTALTAAAGVLDPAAPDAARCARAALDAVQRAGGARTGDKTLVDALQPFVETLEATGGETLPVAWRSAADAAERAAQATEDLRPRLGRARPLAERSLGHPDPGAVSMALVLRTVADQLGEYPTDASSDRSDFGEDA